MLHPIRQMFGEAGELIDKSLLQASLTARIEAYASSMRERGELEMSQEEWEEMKANFPQLSAFFVDEMEDAVNLNGVYSPLGSILSFASRLLPYLGWGCAVILLLSGGLLYLIHRKKSTVFCLPYLYCRRSSSWCACRFPSEWELRDAPWHQPHLSQRPFELYRKFLLSPHSDLGLDSPCSGNRLRRRLSLFSFERKNYR
jgi:hypothetical protein